MKKNNQVSGIILISIIQLQNYNGIYRQALRWFKSFLFDIFEYFLYLNR